MITSVPSAAAAWLSTHSVPQTIKDADGFIATNLRWFGVDNPPAALATSSADHTVAIGASVLLFLGVLAWASWLWERFMKKSDPPILPGLSGVGGGGPPRVIIKNVVTRGNRRHGVYLGKGALVEVDGLESYDNEGDGLHVESDDEPNSKS